MLKVITAMLFIAATPLHANNVLSVCGSLGEISQNIMRARQNDVPLSTTLLAFEDIEEPIKTLITGIIMDAYQSSGYSNGIMQDHAAKAFRNKWEIICVKVLTDEVNT
jgi:hypothetical protein